MYYTDTENWHTDIITICWCSIKVEISWMYTFHQQIITHLLQISCPVFFTNNQLDPFKRLATIAKGYRNTHTHNSEDKPDSGNHNELKKQHRLNLPFGVVWLVTGALDSVTTVLNNDVRFFHLCESLAGNLVTEGHSDVVIVTETVVWVSDCNTNAHTFKCT